MLADDEPPGRDLPPDHPRDRHEVEWQSPAYNPGVDDIVELRGGVLDGEVVTWGHDWARVEWFLDGRLAATPASLVKPNGNEIAVEVCRALRVTKIKCLTPGATPDPYGYPVVAYERSTVPHCLLAHFRDITPGPGDISS